MNIVPTSFSGDLVDKEVHINRMTGLPKQGLQNVFITAES